MGSPLSKGPVRQVGEEEAEHLFVTQLRKTGTIIGSNINNEHEPAKYNHGLTLMHSLNCVPLTASSKLVKHPGDNRLIKADSKCEFPGFSIQWGGQKNKTSKSTDVNVLDFTPSKKQSDLPISFMPHQGNSSNTLTNKTIEINIFPNDYSLNISKENQINFINPSIRENTPDEIYKDRVFEINFSPLERFSHQPTINPTKSAENKDYNQKQSNVSKFFENGPKMATKGKETKAAKRKREEAELAELGEGQGKDEEIISEQSDLDKQNFSDWDVPEDPFIQSYLGGDSDDDVEEKNKLKTKPKKLDIKTPGKTEEDTDEEELPKFQGEVERTRITQVYKPGMKKRRQKPEPSIIEPHRGKGSFGRIEAYIEERKKGHINTMTQRDQRTTRPDFEIMDPGDGEDEWGADRMLEPPPETVVVPWVPYGHKKVVAEDGTVTYTTPDTIYEKFTMTTLGNVNSESMDEEEIKKYIREEKEKEQRRLKEDKEKEEQTLLSLPKEDEDATGYSSTTSEDSDDYEVTWEEFENSKAVNTHPVYGIPTNDEQYGRTLEEEGYLSDADENQPINSRPTEKKDLKVLGDIVKTFRIENPDKDDETVDFFENMRTKEVSGQFSVKNVTTKNEENFEKDYDDDYNDGIQEGIESTDDYDDDVPDVDLLIKDRDTELINFEKRDFITHGLTRVELKRKNGLPNAEECIPEFELISEDEDNNYEDDEVEVEYDDDLKDIKLVKNTDENSSFVEEDISSDSDEDIDPTEESESYDSEEDDYEDHVTEEDYNDGIRLSSTEDSEEDEDEEMDSDDEVDEFFEEETPKQKLLKIQEEADNIDPSFFNEPFLLRDGDDDEDEYDDEDNELSDPWEDSPVLDSTSSESSDYDPDGMSQYGDLSSFTESEDDFEQDYTPADMLQELELQGDTFEDFEYSLDNGTWLDFPYKHPGDAEEARNNKGESDKQLPYWYFLKHPAEDESLMHIRAKLADQYDNQCGPYNPFKVNPPPKPLWLDDTYDLVPEGVEVPDDFFPGFMKLDPETLHRLQLEDDDDDDDDDDDFDDEEEYEDGRSWTQEGTGEIPRKRTWKSWRTRPEDEYSRTTDGTLNTGLRDPMVDSTQTQKTPKKNDQWQHYRDWLLRQGSKSVAKTSQESKVTDNSKPLKSDVSVQEGRFSGKRITTRQEERVQPRPHYQTWLTKQAGLKTDSTTNYTADINANKPHEIQKTTHKHYEEAFVDDKWTESKQRPSEKMWQHYQKWKLKDNTQTGKSNTVPEENVDYFVFSKPPEDIDNQKGSPYSKSEIDLPKNNVSEPSENDLSGLDLMRKSHNLDEHIPSKAPSPESINATVDSNFANSDRRNPVSQKTFQRETQYDSDNRNIRPYTHDIPERAPPNSPFVPHQPDYSGPETPATSMSSNNIGVEGRLTPNMSNNVSPSYSSKNMFNSNSEGKTSSLIKNKTLNRSLYRYSTLLRTRKNVQPKVKQMRDLNKVKPLNSPIHILELDNNLKIKFIDQLGTNDNFTIDISRPYDISKNTPYESSITSRNSRDPPKLFNVPDESVNTEKVTNISKSDVNPNNTIENEKQTTTSGESKPKRKYTRRKQRLSNDSKETPSTGSLSENVASKRKYTRRAKTSTEVSNAATLIKSDDSSHESFNQINEKFNTVKNEIKPHAPNSSASISVPLSINETMIYFDANKSSLCNSTETNFEDNFEEKELQSYEIEQNVNDHPVTSHSSSSEGGTLSSPETANTPEVSPNNFTHISHYKNTAEKKSNTIFKNITHNHWQHYQTYATRQVNEHPVEIVQAPTSIYTSITSPPSVDPGKISQPKSYESKIYPVIHSKPLGDHWVHYKAWLEKNGIRKPLYKSPSSRPVMSTRNPPPPSMKFKVEPVPVTVNENLEKTASTVGVADADEITDEKVEYLHQRWLAWQQNLASKMVNKLNKMLKYYENPEGNITQDTEKVRDMIKQRDYWREIHRWSSRKGFSLYNKTPPQTHPTTLNLTEPRQRLRPQWPVNVQLSHQVSQRDYSKYSAGKSFKPSGSERYKQWSAPDPEVISAQPPTPTSESNSERMEIVKEQEEIKRPKFPAQPGPIEEIKRPKSTYQVSMKNYPQSREGSKRPKFPDQGPIENYLEPREGKKRPKFPDQVTSIEHPSSSASTSKPREMYSRLRKPISQEQGMTYEEKHQDKFFKEISDLLGQTVVVEGKAKVSKSRAVKRLERRMKAKYREQKKERIIEKKYGEFMFRMDRYDEDTGDDDEENKEKKEDTD